MPGGPCCDGRATDPDVLAPAFVERYRGPKLDARIADAAELKTFNGNMAPEKTRRWSDSRNACGGRSDVPRSR